MRKKIIGMFVCMLVVATCLPVTGKIIAEDNEVNNSPIFERPHHITIRLENIYIKECGDDGTREPGEYFFYIFAIPRGFHWKTDIYMANDNIPTEPQHFGKLCTISEVKFTPQRIIILALDDDKAEGLANTNDFLDWTKIKLAPPKGDYPHTDMYEDTFKWTNIYFTADVVVQFYYVTNETAL